MLVLFQPGPRAAAALAEAAALLSADGGARLMNVAIAPQVVGLAPVAYNCAVRGEAAADLREAARRLGPLAQRTTFRLLIEGSDPPLMQWIASSDFDRVLVPTRDPIRDRPTPECLRIAPSSGSGVQAGSYRNATSGSF